MLPLFSEPLPQACFIKHGASLAPTQPADQEKTVEESEAPLSCTHFLLAGGARYPKTLWLQIQDARKKKYAGGPEPGVKL